MTPIKHVAGKAIPFGRKNVDTDVIIPSQYLKTITREGLGRGAFEALRKRIRCKELARAPEVLEGEGLPSPDELRAVAWAADVERCSARGEAHRRGVASCVGC